MRTCCAILILAPLALCANVPRSQTAGQSESPTVQPSSPATETWAPAPFSRYEIILTRKPFGAAVASASAAALAAAAAATPPPPPFVSKLTMVAINRTPAGIIAVGFLDSSISPPHNYYLNVGENEDGYTVTSADIDAESANVNKNGFDIPISMGKGPGAGGTAPSSALAPAASLRVALSDRPPSPALSSTQTIATLKERLRNRIFSSDNARAWPVPANVKTIDAVLDMGIQQESYVEKLKKRRDELAAQAAASQSTAAPATEPIDSTAFLNMLRKQNMDNIRQGGGGLGVPLTPEEDAQLVKEGVLPAR